ncbi:MAG: hypothetical protein ACP5LL_03715 [Thermoplasmata archaeon]
MDKNVNLSNLDVKKIFGESKYVKEINNLKDGIYEIIFSWKKFGITKEFPVKVQELRNEKICSLRTPRIQNSDLN